MERGYKAEPGAITPGRPPLCSQPSHPTDCPGCCYRRHSIPWLHCSPAWSLTGGRSISSSSQHCCLICAPGPGLLAAGFPHSSCGGAKAGCCLFPVSLGYPAICSVLWMGEPLPYGRGSLCSTLVCFPEEWCRRGKGLNVSEPSFDSWRHSGRELGQGDRHVRRLSKSAVIYPSP